MLLAKAIKVQNLVVIWHAFLQTPHFGIYLYCTYIYMNTHVYMYILIHAYVKKDRPQDGKWNIDKRHEKIHLLCFTMSVQLLVRSRKPDSHILYVPCPKGWIGFGRKCFYFSEDSKNWTFSQTFCTSREAALAQFETEEELVRNIFGSCSLLNT